jgi:hypothetical protein
MNHISRSFVSSDGRVYKSHSWEVREGGYRRAALLAGNGLWPVSKETKLISFLLDRGFRVNCLELAFGGAEVPRTGLRGFRAAFAAYARAESRPGIPLYLIASSFSGSALLPVAKGIEGAVGLALIAPVVELPPPKLRMPLFFLPTAELTVRRDDLSGSPEMLEGFFSGASSALKFRKRDLRTAASELSAALAVPLGLPVAAFAGEEDPLLSQAGRESLARAGARVYAYPRVKREPAHDRYADNFFADFGSFLDEVEAGKR